MFNYGHGYFYLIESILNLYIDGRTNTNFNDKELDECIDINFTVTAKSFENGATIIKLFNYSPCSSTFLSSSVAENYYLRAHVHHLMKSDIPLEVTVTIS